MTASIKVVKLLLDSGADPNIQGGRLGNALNAARYRSEGGKDIVQLLIAYGAAKRFKVRKSSKSRK